MFIDKDLKRISIDVPVNINGIVYPHLRDPSIREQLSIQEIPDPIRENDKYYYITEQDTFPYVINTPKNLDQIKQIKIQELASNRYNKEVSGIDFNGSKLATDRGTQATIGSALLRLQRKPNEVIDWKGTDGWVQLDLGAIEMIADVVGDHVQACFTAEKIKQEEIELITDFDTLVAYEVTL